MSELGKQIVRRLTERHGLVFMESGWRMNVYCDRESVAQNRSGLGCMQWRLELGGRLLPRLWLNGEYVPAEIGGAESATAARGWKHWEVTLDREGSLHPTRPTIWIFPATEDATDVPGTEAPPAD